MIALAAVGLHIGPWALLIFVAQIVARKAVTDWRNGEDRGAVLFAAGCFAVILGLAAVVIAVWT